MDRDTVDLTNSITSIDDGQELDVNGNLIPSNNKNKSEKKKIPVQFVDLTEDEDQPASKKIILSSGAVARSHPNQPCASRSMRVQKCLCCLCGGIAKANFDCKHSFCYKCLFETISKFVTPKGSFCPVLDCKQVKEL